MQVLIELDEQTLRRLEKVAPGKSRKRSAFIRAAIQKSLWEIDEEKTRRAYLDEPDVDPMAFDPELWEAIPYGGFDAPTVAPAPKKQRKTPAKKKPQMDRRTAKRVGSRRTAVK